jgi:hypothetical protein
MTPFSSPTSNLEDISIMARSLAHEIGHLILNTADHEDEKSWNLMRDAQLGSTNNADLMDGVQRANIDIDPTSYNADESW